MSLFGEKYEMPEVSATKKERSYVYSRALRMDVKFVRMNEVGYLLKVAILTKNTANKKGKE